MDSNADTERRTLLGEARGLRATCVVGAVVTEGVWTTIEGEALTTEGGAGTAEGTALGEMDCAYPDCATGFCWPLLFSSARFSQKLLARDDVTLGLEEEEGEGEDGGGEAAACAVRARAGGSARTFFGGGTPAFNVTTLACTGFGCSTRLDDEDEGVSALAAVAVAVEAR